MIISSNKLGDLEKNDETEADTSKHLSIYSRLSWYELSAFFLDIMELYCTEFVALKAPKNYIWKTRQPCFFPDIMTWLVNIIHRRCCGQFYIEAVFFLPAQNANITILACFLLCDDTEIEYFPTRNCSEGVWIIWSYRVYSVGLCWDFFSSVDGLDLLNL